MNYEQAKAASFNNGFDIRTQQLMIKFANTAGWSRFLPRLIPSAAPVGRNLAGRSSQWLGDAAVRLGKLPFQGLGKVFGTPSTPGIISRAIGGAGQGILSGLGLPNAGKAVGRLGTSRIGFGASKTNTNVNPFKAQTTGAAAEAPGATATAVPPTATTAPAAGAAPGTVGGATQGTITPEQLNQMAAEGMVTPSSGYGGFSNYMQPQAQGPLPRPAARSKKGPKGKAKAAPAPAVGPEKGPEGPGWMDWMKNKLPLGAQNWMTQNPNAVPFGAGVLGGGVPMYAGHAYANNRRRSELENANWMQRLGLAYQLATNPQGFSDTLRL